MHRVRQEKWRGIGEKAPLSVPPDMKKLPPNKEGGRYFQRNQASLFIWSVMELFLRAALFLCSRPLTTA